MYAKCAFIQATKSDEGYALSKSYDYAVSEELAKQLEYRDIVIVESSRGFVATAVFLETATTVENPDIVTKAVLAKTPVLLPAYIR